MLGDVTSSGAKGEASLSGLAAAKHFLLLWLAQTFLPFSALLKSEFANDDTDRLHRAGEEGH